jgi:hypothetical protein
MEKENITTTSDVPLMLLDDASADHKPKAGFFRFSMQAKMSADLSVGAQFILPAARA